MKPGEARQGYTLEDTPAGPGRGQHPSQPLSAPWGKRDSVAVTPLQATELRGARPPEAPMVDWCWVTLAVAPVYIRRGKMADPRRPAGTASSGTL